MNHICLIHFFFHSSSYNLRKAVKFPLYLISNTSADMVMNTLIHYHFTSHGDYKEALFIFKPVRYICISVETIDMVGFVHISDKTTTTTDKIADTSHTSNCNALVC